MTARPEHTQTTQCVNVLCAIMPTTALSPDARLSDRRTTVTQKKTATARRQVKKGEGQ